MATVEGNLDLTPVMNNLEINGEKSGSEDRDYENQSENNWGFPVDELYKIALKFYKGEIGVLTGDCRLQTCSALCSCQCKEVQANIQSLNQ